MEFLFVSLATISHTLVRMTISEESSSRSFAERDEKTRTFWELLELAQLDDPDLSVFFIDESVVTIRVFNSLGSWSAVSGSSVLRCTPLRGKLHSILSAKE